MKRKDNDFKLEKTFGIYVLYEIVLGLILRTSLNPEFAAPPQRT